ncbi:hypothetical protein B9Z19DRAFT_563473 [Tuber borchii]|uniref:Uncharacterized protein n=1 Tax=Tuber borchii TaxID=42251 RepID=A0A2T7A8L1_TUBBO|nr:hypothetical protein B9Z19DRAFT_563473 [Tuber borchii]
MQYKSDICLSRSSVAVVGGFCPRPYTPTHLHTGTHIRSLTLYCPFPTARDVLYKVQQEKNQIITHLKPEDMSSFLQANRRLANLLTADFAKILSARRYPNRDKRLRKQYKLKRRMAAGWVRKQKAACAGGRNCVKGRGRGRGACGSVLRGEEGGKPSMSSGSAALLLNKVPATVNSAHSPGSSRPVSRGVYSGVNKPLPKVRWRTGIRHFDQVD